MTAELGDANAPTNNTARFAATPWTDVELAGGATIEGRVALERLCRLYYYPVYAHVRQRVASPADAEDLTQAFFAALLEKNFLGAADRRRGRFRSFLLVAASRFLVSAHRRSTALKRGGGQVALELDAAEIERRYVTEPAAELPPDKAFDRRWAQTLLDLAALRLREVYVQRGNEKLFERLREFASDATEHSDYTGAARDLGMSPGAVSVAVHRLRERYRDALLAEIERTVTQPDQIEQELRYLVATLDG